MHFVQDLSLLVYVLGAILNTIFLGTGLLLTKHERLVEALFVWPLAVIGAFASSFVVGLVQRVIVLGSPWPDNIRLHLGHFVDRVWRRQRWEAILWGCQKMDLPYSLLGTFVLLYYIPHQWGWIGLMWAARAVVSLWVSDHVFVTMLPLPTFIEHPGQSLE